MSCLNSLGWYPVFWTACLFICGFCVGNILSTAYWRKRFVGLSRMLDGLKKQQDLVNQFHTGKIDEDELMRRLEIFYHPGTMH